MNMSKIDINEDVQAPEAIELIDCGRASEKTQGTMLILFLEDGIPPNNWLYL
jgi:hypothetical protein